MVRLAVAYGFLLPVLTEHDPLLYHLVKEREDEAAAGEK